MFKNIYNNIFWQVSSIIFADLPVSTGFTYATTKLGAKRSDLIQVNQAHEFLRKVPIFFALISSIITLFFVFKFCLQLLVGRQNNKNYVINKSL